MTKGVLFYARYSTDAGLEARLTRRRRWRILGEDQEGEGRGQP